MNTTASDCTVFEMTTAHWQSLGKSGAAHKHRYGHAAIVSGPTGQGGAARLAARGALRIGAGVVSVLCQADALQEHAAQLNAIMVKPFAKPSKFAEHLAAVSPQAVCIGPNLGLGHASQNLLSDVVSRGLPACFDADAITLMADSSVSLPTLSNPQSVLTPHEGELRRLIPDVFATTSCRRTLAQAAADKMGCVVLFKGPETIVAAPNTASRIVSAQPFKSTSWLATAGSGDVLAGFVTGLLARGFDALDAACIAAYLHFSCAEAIGAGLIAEDIPEALPKILRLSEINPVSAKSATQG
ncbi:NAD(P)H-hydrate dehydratase [uncultured Sulfitobacter sp.]|uniref:NAD(P)H-hydrate dehydratase n=1 Tax=uncultured Sulfitobacter sp. TaxID=191468 RepID=UPI00261BABBC|nr:NAD(P)H-hydrate dehydratase [uncultured Sulfitobacter sp.]